MLVPVATPGTDDEKKAIAFAHLGSDWWFYCGTFFDKKMGFVFTTNGQGKMTAVKFSLLKL
jgi:hypothetical protein